MKIQFPFRTRLGLVVATVIAQEVLNGLRPVLMSIRQRGGRDVFHFEGGVVITPWLVDINSFPGYYTGDLPRQDWVVLSANVRFYKRDEAEQIIGKKVSEEWDSEKLIQLKNKNWWHQPRVQNIESVTGVVAIFFDHAAGDGYVEVDPFVNQEGGYILQEEFIYKRLVPGDVDRAAEEAATRLSEYYR